MISFGKKPAIKYFEEDKFLEIKIAKPDEKILLLDCIKAQVSDVKQINVCLSGGIDSQFMLRLATQLNVPVHAYTYLTTWNGSPINTDDYVYAQMCATKENVNLTTINIDLTDFLNNNCHLEYGKKYKISSPQIAVHLHFLKLISSNPGTFFLGGEMPLLCKNSNLQEGPGAVWGINPAFLIRTALPYHVLASDLNISIIKDIFLYSPEIFYLTLKESINVVKKYNIHLEKRKGWEDNICSNTIKSKILNDLIPGQINTLNKATGFENLKKHLAGETGIYNQFDITYRKPMVDMYAKNMKRTSSKIEAQAKFTPGSIFTDITEEFHSIINKHNSVPIFRYLYDF